MTLHLILWAVAVIAVFTVTIILAEREERKDE
jgi:hypothetical protein